MNALVEFILSGCSKVKKLPEFGESMECLSMLSLRNCKSLVCLPQSIRSLKSLRNLNIRGCSRLFRLPNNSNENNSLEGLEVIEIVRREVPSSFSDLKALKILLFKGCDWLITNSWSLSLPIEKVFGFVKYPLSMGLKLPPLSCFPMLKKLRLSYCNLSDGSIPDDIGHLSSLEELYLGGNNFVNLATSISNLSWLHRLSLKKCQRLQTLPALPPSVDWLSLCNCTQLQPIFFDPQKIWKIFEANRCRWNLSRSMLFMVPGSEIPPWFENQDYFPLDPHLIDRDYHEKYAFIASIIVDIPDYCRSSDWMGIAVCHSLEGTLKRHRHKHSSPIKIRWAFKAPDAELVYPLRILRRHSTGFRGHHLLITIFGSDSRIYKPHLRGGQNKVQLIIYGENNCKCGKLKLSNVGNRVLCKEDELWRRGEATSEDEMPSISINPGILKQATITDITDELE